MNSKLTAPLMEIFASIQGEGKYLGQPQIFIRFARCPLRCLYCDTPASWNIQARYRVYSKRGSRLLANPATPQQILRACKRLERELGIDPLPLSLTGGEPLLYPAFIRALASLFATSKRRIHLETAGIHPKALHGLLDVIDHVSMDWKLVSTLEYGDFRQVQKKFLSTALARKNSDVVVKIVLTPQVTRSEFVQAIETIASVSQQVPVILQPVTPKRKIRRGFPQKNLLPFLAAAKRELSSVQILPQLHPLLGVK